MEEHMINPIFSCYPLLFREDSGLIFKEKTHQTLVSRDFSEIIEKIYFLILISFSRFFHYRPVWWTLLVVKEKDPKLMLCPNFDRGALP